MKRLNDDNCPARYLFIVEIVNDEIIRLFFFSGETSYTRIISLFAPFKLFWMESSSKMPRRYFFFLLSMNWNLNKIHKRETPCRRIQKNPKKKYWITRKFFFCEWKEIYWNRMKRNEQPSCASHQTTLFCSRKRERQMHCWGVRDSVLKINGWQSKRNNYLNNLWFLFLKSRFICVILKVTHSTRGRHVICFEWGD